MGCRRKKEGLCCTENGSQGIQKGHRKGGELVLGIYATFPAGDVSTSLRGRGVVDSQRRGGSSQPEPEFCKTYHERRRPHEFSHPREREGRGVMKGSSVFIEDRQQRKKGGVRKTPATREGLEMRKEVGGEVLVGTKVF